MPKRIAIVEDDPALRANYSDALARQGYEVAAYSDRPSALAAFRTRLPELALLDIGLGDEIEGGFALCRELRAMSATLPILFLTARDSDFDIVGPAHGVRTTTSPKTRACRICSRASARCSVARNC